MNRQELGKIIQTRRKTLNVTQVDLALISGVSTKQLSNIEQGKVSPTMDMLSKICDTLGLVIEVNIKGVAS